MGIRADPQGARLVRRRQVGDLHPLGPLFGAGLGAARPRHSAAAHPRRPEAHAAGEPVRRVVPQLHADQGQPDPGVPRPDLRRGLPLRQLRAHVRRRVVRRRARRDRRPLPGGGGPLRRAHHQAPRRLRPLALPCPAPGQGRVPRPTRPGGRSRARRCGPGACAWGSTTRAATTGPTTTPCCRPRPMRCWPLPKVPATWSTSRRTTASSSTATGRPSCGTTSRGPRTPGCPSSSRTTTTPWRMASSTTAGGSPAWPATR